MSKTPILDAEDALHHTLARRLQELPVLPAVVTRLLTLDHSSEEYFDVAREAVEADPPLAARIITCANSARFAAPSPIASLRAALPWLGSSTVRHLILSAAVARVFHFTTPAQRRLWTHSVQVAITARQIVSQSSACTMDPDAMYLAGLLHDIGRFLMPGEPLDEHGDEMQWSNPATILSAERQLSGFDHAELGWRACLAWRLPDEIATIIRDHHHESILTSALETPSHRTAVLILQTADAFSTLLHRDVAMTTEPSVDRIAASCFDPQAREQVIDAAALAEAWPALVRETNQLLKLLDVQAL